MSARARFNRPLSACLVALIALTAQAMAAVPRRNPAAAPQPMVERARVLMGTVCTVQIDAVDTTRAAAAAEAAFAEIARLEQVMTSWRDDSELAGLNAGGFETRYPCSADLYAVLDSALAVAAETDGAFDPTVGPLIAAWDLRGEGRVPTHDEITGARLVTGWRRVTLEPSARTARLQSNGMAVDLGGIGKGYALDHAAEVLRGMGVRRALLDFGGQVLALTQRQAWKVAVADPADRLRPAVLLPLSNGSVSTSAQSEQGFTQGGVYYGHILDPRTGSPLTTTASVSVVARAATRADALSTALLVMGRDGAAAYAAAHPAIGVLWLEPADSGVKAWTWNLTAVAAAPEARVQWMTRP